MGTKLFSTLVTLTCTAMLGCGGKISDGLPSDPQPADMTPAEAAVEGGVEVAPPAMESSEQAPSFCGGRATSVVRVTANLDATASAINTEAIVGPPPIAAHPFDPQEPVYTANFSTTVTIYDSLGLAHPLEIYFRKCDTHEKTWDYHLLVPADAIGGASDGNFEVGGGTLRFDSSGALSSDSGSPVTIAFRNGSVEVTIDVDFAGRTGAPGTNAGVTSVDEPSNVMSQFQDGYAASWGSGPCATAKGSACSVRTRPCRR